MTLRDKDCEEVASALQGKKTGYRYSDLARWMNRAGAVEVSRKGSHRTWKHPSGRYVTLREGSGHVLPCYVSDVGKLLLEEDCHDAA